MDIKRLLDCYTNWYEDLDVYVESSIRAIVIDDLRTGSRYYVYSVSGLMRTFKDLSVTRIACGVL